MDEVKLSDDVIEQIKDFKHYPLTEKHELLIDKLILNEELKSRYKEYGLCYKCKQPNTGKHNYCQACFSKRFQQNFKNWTSGNHDVDEFIQKAQLKAKNGRQAIEWIEYDNFEVVKYLAEGGFGTTFKAMWKDGFICGGWNYNNNQWNRIGRFEKTKVALKCLHNSQDITVDFLEEVKSNIIINDGGWIVRCFGITKDPKTNNFMMVMQLLDCNLRQHLDNNFIPLDWKEKIYSLHSIANGLKNIHNSGLIHHDFHCGNILSDFTEKTYITDLGLCQPANVKTSHDSNKKIYGVLPYVAPEVLRGKEYTQAGDIYAFGIVAYEVCTGLPPYHDVVHDELLALDICKGLRPESTNKIPQDILNIINQCWDVDPLKRPKADELHKSIWNLHLDIANNEQNSAIHEQIREANEFNKKSSTVVQTLSSSTSALLYTTHPLAVYTSRLLDFKNLPEPKNADNNETLEYLRIDFTKLDINSKDPSSEETVNKILPQTMVKRQRRTAATTEDENMEERHPYEKRSSNICAIFVQFCVKIVHQLLQFFG